MTRLRTLILAACFAILASGLVACGGGEDEGETTPEEKAATYPVEVVTAEFPTRQRLGETSLLRLGVRNAGEERIPALTVMVTIAGQAGEDSGLPFAIRDPQPGLSQPDRPVWVLSENYPRLAGSEKSAGAETAARRTYDFGPLPAGETIEAIWKLNAVKQGRWTLSYAIGAGLGGKAKAEAPGGGDAGGTITVRIVDEPPDTEVNDSGEVVEIDETRGSGS